MKKIKRMANAFLGIIFGIYFLYSGYQSFQAQRPLLELANGAKIVGYAAMDSSGKLQNFSPPNPNKPIALVALGIITLAGGILLLFSAKGSGFALSTINWRRVGIYLAAGFFAALYATFFRHGSP